MSWDGQGRVCGLDFDHCASLVDVHSDGSQLWECIACSGRWMQDRDGTRHPLPHDHRWTLTDTEVVSGCWTYRCLGCSTSMVGPVHKLGVHDTACLGSDDVDVCTCTGAPEPSYAAEEYSGDPLLDREPYGLDRMWSEP